MRFFFLDLRYFIDELAIGTAKKRFFHNLDEESRFMRAVMHYADKLKVSLKKIYLKYFSNQIPV